jgi:hypothetical protein
MTDITLPEDTILCCVDCGKPFPWTAGEKRYYLSKGLSQPKRCEPCRAFRRQTIAPGPTQRVQ